MENSGIMSRKVRDSLRHVCGDRHCYSRVGTLNWPVIVNPPIPITGGKLIDYVQDELGGFHIVKDGKCSIPMCRSCQNWRNVATEKATSIALMSLVNHELEDQIEESFDLDN